jgi:hypothetical protein
LIIYYEIHHAGGWVVFFLYGLSLKNTTLVEFCI